jgi:hypothetical protein
MHLISLIVHLAEHPQRQEVVLDLLHHTIPAILPLGMMINTLAELR